VRGKSFLELVIAPNDDGELTVFRKEFEPSSLSSLSSSSSSSSSSSFGELDLKINTNLSGHIEKLGRVCLSYYSC
jgi:hypothetical protein